MGKVPDHSWISGIVHPIHAIVGKVPDHSWISGIIHPIHAIMLVKMDMTGTHSPDNILLHNRGGGCGLGMGGRSEHTSFHLSWAGLLVHLRIPIRVL